MILVVESQRSQKHFFDNSVTIIYKRKVVVLQIVWIVIFKKHPIKIG